MSHGVHRGVLKKGKFDERELFIENLKKLTPNIKYDLYGMENNQPVWADNFINKISKSFPSKTLFKFSNSLIFKKLSITLIFN